MSLPERESGIAFESLIFRGSVTEISFTEPHDRGQGVVQIRTVVVEGSVVPDEYKAFLIALVDFVEAAQVALRAPPDQFDG